MEGYYPGAWFATIGAEVFTQATHVAGSPGTQKIIIGDYGMANAQRPNGV